MTQNFDPRSIACLRILIDLYWFSDNKRKKRILETLFLLTQVIYYIGVVGFIVHRYRNGGNFSDIAFNLSVLISTAFSSWALYTVKIREAGCYKALYLMGNNTYVQTDNKRFTSLVRHNNIFYQITSVFAFAVGVITFIYVETETCLETSDPFKCGYVIPSYFFVETIGPLRIGYNLLILCFVIYQTYGCLITINALYLLVSYLEICSSHVKFTLRLSRISPLKSHRRRNIYEAYDHIQYMKRIWFQTLIMYQGSLLAQVVSSGLSMALILISEYIKFNFLSLVHLSAYVVATLTLGWVAEKAINIRDELRYTIFYSCPWEGDIGNTKRLIFMNLNALKGFTLEVNGYEAYSNELVLSVFRFAYSVLTLFINCAL